MPTSTPKHRNRYKVAEAKQQMHDKIGSDEIEVELEDGSVLSIPHPMFYSSALKKELKKLADDDSEGMLRALVGDEKCDAALDGGFDPEDLGFVMQQVQEDTQAALAGRARPTRS